MSNVYSDSMSQVTGRLFNLGGDLEEIDILAWPVMDTAARNPRYAFRLPVNEQGISLSPKSTLLLRLYTIHAHDSQLVVVGNCLYEIFNDKVRRCIFFSWFTYPPTRYLSFWKTVLTVSYFNMKHHST